MTTFDRITWVVLVLVGLLFLSPFSTAIGQSDAEGFPGADSNKRVVPDSLVPWIPWVLWDDRSLGAPPLFNDSSQVIRYWASRLRIDANDNEGNWKTELKVFSECWVPIPGDTDHWPQQVRVGDKPAIVVERAGVPSIRLEAGEYQVQGQWSWNQMPQKISIPPTFGLIELNVNSDLIRNPTWDTNGSLWLKRSQASETQQDQTVIQIHRMIADGSPIWLKTWIDITVSGKSREEEIGYVLPEGWQLSLVSSPIPVAMDESGRLKAQLRQGTWRVRIDAYRNQDLEQLKFADGVQPAVASEWIAVRANPEMRMVELQGATPVDVQLTTFPEEWRELSVFEWNHATPLLWVEKTRGMGLQKPDEFHVARDLWLDDDGRGVTYQDVMDGQPKQIARLDVADQHELGVVRVDGIRQLITENPETHSHGFEVRTRHPSVEAIGRAPGLNALAATGWKTDADFLSMRIYLPPGWRVLAMFGPDSVRGDWLTSWTLLDLFLLLVFTIAVFRLWGMIPAIIALLAFGLTYHEVGSPRLTWFFLLIPIAILRVIRDGKHPRWLIVWRAIAGIVLLLNLIPFVAIQVQNAIYPQLEPIGIPYESRTMFEWLRATHNASADVADSVALEMEQVSGRADVEAAAFSRSFDPQKVNSGAGPFKVESIVERRDHAVGMQIQQQSQMANMAFSPGTSIQTGIAKPKWYGNQVVCSWDGPVKEDQTIRPILISCNMHRLITAVRLVFLGGLLAILLRGESGWKPTRWRLQSPLSSSSAKSLAALVLAAGLAVADGGTAIAQYPDAEILKQLHERLLRPADAFPQAADIPKLKIAILDGGLEVDGEVHAAADSAVPVPGKMPSWVPIQVQLDGKDATVCRRDDGYLWVWVPKGVHSLKLRGLLGESTEWVWAFALPPRFLEVDAPDWNVTGLSEEGKPESQLFFVRKEQNGEGEASYDQKNFRSVVQVDRAFEIGLVWKIHTTVRRLSSVGKAISVQVPLVPGERVLTSNIAQSDGNIEVNLNAEATTVEWDSELGFESELLLQSKASNGMVERWSVNPSPVWNIGFEGLQPIYESHRPELIPVWNPWPGEQVRLTFRKPMAVIGKLLTIKEVTESLVLGSRQRTSRLEVQVESSLGGDFPLKIPESGTVTSLEVDRRPVPVRRQGVECLIPLQPGLQTINLLWTSDEPMTSLVRAPYVELPEEVSNLRINLSVPESRWILWADGPMRGPAIRFWTILAVAILAAVLLGQAPKSPLKTYEWILLGIGLTQVHALAGLLVVGWLFAIRWRSDAAISGFSKLGYRTLQVLLIVMTVAAVGVLLTMVGSRLLGSPEMYITGNGSYRGELLWFSPSSEAIVPRPWIFSISVWYYRLLMLVWALWLANSMLGWLQAWWTAMNQGSFWRVGEPTVSLKKEDDGTHAVGQPPIGPA